MQGKLCTFCEVLCVTAFMICNLSPFQIEGEVLKIHLWNGEEETQTRRKSLLLLDVVSYPFGPNVGGGVALNSRWCFESLWIIGGCSPCTPGSNEHLNCGGGYFFEVQKMQQFWPVEPDHVACATHMSTLDDIRGALSVFTCGVQSFTILKA